VIPFEQLPFLNLSGDRISFRIYYCYDSLLFCFRSVCPPQMVFPFVSFFTLRGFLFWLFSFWPFFFVLRLDVTRADKNRGFGCFFCCLFLNGHRLLSFLLFLCEVSWGGAPLTFLVILLVFVATVIFRSFFVGCS